jgi:hypothetical protein
MAEVAGQIDQPDIRVRPELFEEKLLAAVPAAVIHEQQLEPVGECARHLAQSAVKNGEIPFFVVERQHDGD